MATAGFLNPWLAPVLLVAAFRCVGGDARGEAGLRVVSFARVARELRADVIENVMVARDRGPRQDVPVTATSLATSRSRSRSAAFPGHPGQERRVALLPARIAAHARPTPPPAAPAPANGLRSRPWHRRDHEISDDAISAILRTLVSTPARHAGRPGGTPGNPSPPRRSARSRPRPR